MARPKNEHPTPAELETLQLLWDHGPMTVREVMGLIDDDRAYTSVMSLMNVMAEKGMLERESEGRAFRYRPLIKRSDTVGQMLGDLLSRAFDGSAKQLMVHLLDAAQPGENELLEIRRAIQTYERADTIESGSTESASSPSRNPSRSQGDSETDA